MEKTSPPHDKLCRAEFHLECMETSKRKWREFNGMGLEEFVDFVAEKIGIEVWYTGLPRYGRYSDLLQSYYESEDIRETDIPDDFNRRFVSRAHSHGILVVAAFKMNLFPALGRLKPEWLIQDIPDGRTIEPNTKYLCHNTPFGDWLIDFLREQVSRYNYDGVWFDDTQYSSRGAWPWWPAGCLCDECRDLYRKETTRELPERVDWSSREFKHWVNWRYDNLRAYQRRIAAGIREVNPDTLVVYNSYPRASLHWSTANDLNRADPQLIYFIETDYRRMGPTLTAKIARARGNAEIWGWAPQLTGDLKEIGVAPYLDVEFCERFYLTGFANGVHVQGITDYVVPENVPGKPFKRLKQLAEHFGGRSIRQCALLLSRRTRDFYYTTEYGGDDGAVQRGDTDDFWKQASGIVEMLEQLHYQYDVVFDDSIDSESLELYRVLVLPNSACLSEAACAAITEWVRAGGTLIATYETSLFDELGEKRANFALCDALGIDYAGTYDKHGSSGTILVPHSSLREEIGNVLGFAGQHTLFSLRDKANTEVLATFATVRRFGPINFRTEAYDSGHPAVVSHRHGKGTTVYISGDIGTGFRDHPLPLVRSFLGRILEKTAYLIKIQAPATLFATTFETDSDVWNVHLYQRFSAMHPWEDNHPDVQQWSALSEPNTYVDVRMTVPESEIESARLLIEGSELSVEGGVVRVPFVRQYALVQLRFKDRG